MCPFIETAKPVVSTPRSSVQFTRIVCPEQAVVIKLPGEYGGYVIFAIGLFLSGSFKP